VVRPASAAANGSAQSKENRVQGVLPPVATRNNSIVAPGRNGNLGNIAGPVRPLSAGRPPWATNNANRFPRPPAGGVAPVRGRTPPGIPAASFRPPPSAGAGGPARHSHTPECRVGAACCAEKECVCAACSARVRAQGLQAQLHQLSQQNSCLVGQVGCSVADPGCLSFVKHFFVATNFPKCKIILFLNCSRKKFGPNFKELWNFLPKKLSISSQKYEFVIRDPRSRIQGSKGTQSRIPDPDPQYW
jgi:hypothetical protein